MGLFLQTPITNHMPPFLDQGGSTIDFFFIPKSLLAEVTKCHTLLGMVHRLSSSNTRQIRDHAPLLLQWRVFFAADAKKDIVWDTNKLMQALQGVLRIRDGFNVQFKRQFLSISKERSAHVAEDLVPAAAAQIARHFDLCSCFTPKSPDKACFFCLAVGFSPVHLS